MKLSRSWDFATMSHGQQKTAISNGMGFYTIFQLFHTPFQSLEKIGTVQWTFGGPLDSARNPQSTGKHNFCRSQNPVHGKRLTWEFMAHFPTIWWREFNYCSSTVPMTDPWDERFYLPIHERLIFPKVNSGEYTSSSHGSNGSVLWRYGIHVWDCYGRNIPAYVQVLVSFIYNHFWVFSFQLVRCKMCKPSLWEMNSKISWLSHTCNRPHLLEVHFLVNVMWCSRLQLAFWGVKSQQSWPTLGHGL